MTQDLDIGRRGFIGGLAASAATSWATESGEPLVRIGLVTDTHVRETRESCERVARAYRLFKREKVGMIVNCGDIADKFYPKGYALYSAIRRETYPDPAAAPKEVYVWANHDRMDFPGDEGPGARLLAFAEVKRLLGIPNEAYDKFVFCGFTFLVFPQWLDWKRYEKTIADACAENPGKPVFIFDHVPPIDTTDNSRSWGCKNRRRILEKFPQVINISGHAHGSLRNEQNIWQGAFTDVSVGCLAQFGGDFAGVSTPAQQNWSCIVMELWPDHAVFHRRSLLDETFPEIGAQAPWTVTWPHNGRNAPYSRETLRRARPVPVFPAGANLAVATVGNPMERVNVAFPGAVDSDTAYCYRLEVFRKKDGAWSRFVLRELRGEFWKEPKEREGRFKDVLSGGYFDDAGDFRISVTPVNFWGGEGLPLVWEGAFPKPVANKVVWQGLPKLVTKKTGLRDVVPGEKVPYSGDTYFKFPAEAWEGPGGTRFRLVADLTLEQGNVRGFNFLLQKSPTEKVRPFSAIHTPRGNSSLRYTVDFSKRASTDTYDLFLRQGDAGTVQIDMMRLERLS